MALYDAAGRLGLNTISQDFIFSIRHGDYPGLTVKGMRGSNPDIDMANDEDLIPWGGLYAFQSAAVPMQILSSAAADNSAGTGLRTAFILGLDNSFNEISETITLNGVTPVACVNSYRRINSLVGVTAGSGLVNAGTVNLRVTAGAVIQAEMPVGQNLSRHGIYTIPTGRIIYPFLGSADIRAATANSITVLLLQRDLALVDAAEVVVGELSVQGQGTSTIVTPLPWPSLPGPRDIILKGSQSTANNVEIVATVSFVEER